MGAFDADFLQSQKDAILKGLNNMDEEIEQLSLKKEESRDPFEGKSMAEILREKREATDKILEKTKVNQQESIEERRQRLRAHRDMLLKQKNDQRQAELEQFNTKATNKQDLFKELKEMDSKIQAKGAFEQ
jgi:acyl-CoA reductase-like NAD-dependent aldehyde dehydrogenase